MFVRPAFISLGICDVQTSVVAGIATVLWELSALVRPLLALPLAALVTAAANEFVLPALAALAAAD